jgi:hypothetical protein
MLRRASYHMKVSGSILDTSCITQPCSRFGGLVSIKVLIADDSDVMRGAIGHGRLRFLWYQ